tara:strand:- start:190 stop:726 length:537 start_codon:yes stop_codon:yes gene_type:complete
MKRRQMYPLDSINNQLNIGVPNDPNIPSRYARGLFTMQPQLGVEDWSLDFYNDIDSLRRFSSAQGEDNYSGFLGIGYPACVRDVCRKCKNKCKNEQGLKWGKGGKSCHKTCVGEWRDAGKPIVNAPPPANAAAAKADEAALQASQDNTKGLSTGAKVGIAVGVLAVIGVVGYLIIRKK